MDEIEKLASQIPGTTHAWSGLSYEERVASGQTLSLYLISILVIFLCLAALYESWSVPFSVLLVIPLGVVGAVLAAKFRGLENDVYFRVALLTTIGLASKNAILIVEFAEEAYHRGATAIDAAITGAKLRLRPIIDDLARVRRRRHAARDLDRRRREQPRLDRLRHRRRHVDRNAARDLLRPGVLRDRAQDRAPENGRCREARILFALALAGCYSMAPTYERPAAPVPTSCRAGRAATAPPAARAVRARIRSSSRSSRA